jgi:Beta-1,3-glucanase/Carbohydrate binding module (family 6)
MVDSLNIALKNTTSGTVYAYITGRSGDALCLIQADGKTSYFPPSPAGTLSSLGVDCAIRLGAPGSTTTVTIPQLSAARIWFSVDAQLVFLLNPGPSLVEPSVANPSDPNINILWGFCELTLNSDQLYANISYVDFVSLPISMSLTNASGKVQQVKGIPKDGLDAVCNGLAAQNAADGVGWDKLIVKNSAGQNLRALSPNLGRVVNPSLFSGYFEPYVNLVWDKYSSTSLSIDTQASFGTVQGNVSGGTLIFSGLGSFSRPSTGDIFSCSTGPFITDSPSMSALTPRLCAAFNRSTLLSLSSEPSDPAGYYKNPVTNHYSRILHETNLDRRGYAFPYDDVAPSGGVDQSGSVFDPDPSLLSIVVGGDDAGVPHDATSRIQAEDFDTSNAVKTEPTSDADGGRNVGWIANGDWIGFNIVDFHMGGMNMFIARVASGAAPGVSGMVQVAIDSPTATPVASFPIQNTGGWQSWTTVSASMSRVTGVHAVYITFANSGPDEFANINWFTFANTNDAASRIQAENFDTSNGVKTEATTDVDGGRNVGWIANGDWIGFASIDFHADGMDQFTARVSSGAAPGVSGLVQVSIDSPAATPVASFSIANTGGWQSWSTIPANMSKVTGVHAVYLTFASGQPDDFVNVNWFTFSNSNNNNPSNPSNPSDPTSGKKYKSVVYFVNWVC